jgi:hypothetical protein
VAVQVRRCRRAGARRPRHRHLRRNRAGGGACFVLRLPLSATERA